MDDETGQARVPWVDDATVPLAGPGDAEFSDDDEGTVDGIPVRSVFGSERDGA
jgi:hypothetical protein